MNTEIEKILKHTPYNSYEDLYSAVFSNRARIGLSNGACRQIAGTRRPFFAGWGVHIGFIPSAILTVCLSIHSKNYLLLLLLLLELIFPMAVYLLKNLRIKTWYIPVIILFVNSLIYKLPLAINILAISWLLNCLIVSWWQKKLYVMSVKLLQYDKDTFVRAYYSSNLLITDCCGNTYDFLRQKEIEKRSEERLLEVLKIGSGIEDVREAISEFTHFYNEKGKHIPSDLYIGVWNLPEKDQIDKLVAILELGTGASGIDEVTNKLIEFYKSKGISIPKDLCVAR
ncbi:MAG: hypothetical protein IJY94_06665 [Clostridia bacterium]|nr:hypothetical protein [Clostridia bacterium]